MTTAPDAKKRGNLPPYTSFKTLTGFVQKLKETTVPNRVDGSVLRSYAGSVARQLVLTLKFLKLIEQNGATLERLKKLVAAYGTDNWKMEIGDLMSESYSPIIGNLDLDNGSYLQLADAFRVVGADGVVLDRAISFYLSGLKEAGMQYSPHFESRPRRSRQEKTRASKKKINDNGDDGGEDDDLIIPPTMAKFNLPIPDKGAAIIVLPVDISSDDWEMINLMMKAYVSRLEKSARV